jgi:hypothetical protein
VQKPTAITHEVAARGERTSSSQSSITAASGTSIAMSPNSINVLSQAINIKTMVPFYGVIPKEELTRQSAARSLAPRGGPSAAEAVLVQTRLLPDFQAS